MPESTSSYNEEDLRDRARQKEQQKKAKTAAHKPSIYRLSDVEPELVEWLWPGRIPAGKVTIIDGDPGLGKSTLALDIAARITTGEPFPPLAGEHRDPADVLILSAEDGLGDTIRPRIDAAGADASRAYALTSVPDEKAEHHRPPALPDDIPTIQRLITGHGIALVVIDPLMAFLNGKVDAHRDQDIRRAMAPLSQLGEDTGAAIIIVRHLRKSRGPAVHSGGGSIGIVGAARMGHVVAADPDEDDVRVFAPTKSNLAASAPALRFALRDSSNGVARVEWLGESRHSADSLMVVPTEEDRSALGEAKDFLRQLLGDGPADTKSIFSEARSAGIAEKTLRRAKTELGVATGKTGMHGGWRWALPVEDGQATSSATFGGNGWTESPPEQYQEFI